MFWEFLNCKTNRWLSFTYGFQFVHYNLSIIIWKKNLYRLQLLQTMKHLFQHLCSFLGQVHCLKGEALLFMHELTLHWGHWTFSHLHWITEWGLNETLDRVRVSEQKGLEIIFYFNLFYFNLIYLILKTQNLNSIDSGKYHVDDWHLNQRHKSKRSQIFNLFSFCRMVFFSNHRCLWFNFSLFYPPYFVVHQERNISHHSDNSRKKNG